MKKSVTLIIAFLINFSLLAMDQPKGAEYDLTLLHPDKLDFIQELIGFDIDHDIPLSDSPLYLTCALLNAQESYTFLRDFYNYKRANGKLHYQEILLAVCLLEIEDFGSNFGAINYDGKLREKLHLADKIEDQNAIELTLDEIANHLVDTLQKNLKTKVTLLQNQYGKLGKSKKWCIIS